MLIDSLAQERILQALAVGACVKPPGAVPG
jgi:hypothetical protein